MREKEGKTAVLLFKFIAKGGDGGIGGVEVTLLHGRIGTVKQTEKADGALLQKQMRADAQSNCEYEQYGGDDQTFDTDSSFRTR